MPTAQRIPRKRWLFLAIPIGLGVLWFASSFLPVGGTPIWEGNTTEKLIALTFDDGPSDATPQILDILSRYGVQATFFTVGANVRRYPAIARRIVAEGHQVGNHSDHHSYTLPYLLPNMITDDYRTSENSIREATGVAPRFYRAPHGRLSPWMRWDLRNNGLILVGWTYSPQDWANPGTDEIVKRVLAAARPGAIILLHDGLDLNSSPDKSQLIQALPIIIERLQAEGFHFVTVAQLIDKRPYF